MKTFKQRLQEMSWDISELEPHGRADQSTHEVSQMKLKDTGDIYFVKFSDKDLYDDLLDSNLHPIIEYLSYKIYKLFKLPVPEVDLVIDNNRIGLASKATKGKPVKHLDLLKTKNIADFFAVSAFIANWDWSGTGFEAGNILVDNGKATLIDPGGSLTFRAQGARKGKMFSNNVGEVETLQDPSMSQAAEVFKRVNVTKSLKSFVKIPWSKVNALLKKEDKYIKTVIIDSKLLKVWNKEYKTIQSTLEKRYKSLIQIIKEII